MKNIPKEIYLNLGIPKRVFDITRDDIDFKQLNGVSWSTDKIDDQDLKFVLSDVSQQRELLLAFMEFYHSSAYCPANTTFKEDVDAFLKANNCG